MAGEARQSVMPRLLVATAAFVIVVAGMRAAQSLLVPFLLSIFIAIISAPPLFWLTRKRVPTALALVIVIGGVLAIGLGMTALIGASLDGFSRSLPVYQARLQEGLSALLAWFDGAGMPLPGEQLREQLDPGAAMGLAASLLAGLGNALKNVFLILLTVIFILLEASTVPAKLRAAFGANVSLTHFNTFVENVYRYMAIKTVVSLVTGIAIAVWLAILGVDFAVLWGVLAFLLNYIPNIGSIIAAVPAVLLALVQLGPGSALLAAVGYVVVNIVLATLIEPRFMGRGLGLSTLVVFLSLVFWGWVLGPVGMLLAVPLTMMVKIALDSNEETRWLAILLGSGAAPSTD